MLNNCYFTVDTKAPEVLDCSSNITQNVEAGLIGTVVTWKEPSAVDASGNVTLLIKTHSPGQFFPVGNTLVSYVFVDSLFHVATCCFFVLVTSGMWIWYLVRQFWLILFICECLNIGYSHHFFRTQFISVVTPEGVYIFSYSEIRNNDS